MATETMKLRGRPVTAEEATLAVRRLINSHFRNNDQARCSIPVEPMDDDVVAGDYVLESEARIAELKAKLAALDWTPITEDNGPPSKGKWLGWHPSWSDHVVMCHYDSDGEVCGEWCEELGEQSLPYNNPTHFKLLNPPQEPS